LIRKGQVKFVKDNVIYNIIIGSSSAMQVVGKCSNHPTKKKVNPEMTPLSLPISESVAT
jgi:hypothetical protein